MDGLEINPETQGVKKVIGGDPAAAVDVWGAAPIEEMGETVLIENIAVVCKTLFHLLTSLPGVYAL